jgi:hypothetical protein
MLARAHSFAPILLLAFAFAAPAAAAVGQRHLERLGRSVRG